MIWNKFHIEDLQLFGAQPTKFCGPET